MSDLTPFENMLINYFDTIKDDLVEDILNDKYTVLLKGQHTVDILWRGDVISIWIANQPEDCSIYTFGENDRLKVNFTGLGKIKNPELVREKLLSMTTEEKKQHKMSLKMQIEELKKQLKE